ncbi:MAG: formylmethanofuran dehydrogenase subunit E family protein [Candidatus Omnitrophica bacterium]|nr:formylmethanofuran dehydrogenase subunit E family protein [Candidatus Omnitrophota bacterium]MDD5654850.1 formylmethanofuran dehydrogenase subunit E family protein [Candidatus Omnitrophota bacterium]
MADKRITLKEAIKFHGHLGPYLVLGLLAGEWALKKLKAGKHFGIEVKVWGADKKPKSCFIDGLQLSTGATYGKGNIGKFRAKKICVLIFCSKNNKKVVLSFKEDLVKRLNALKGHRDSEACAARLYKTDPLELFSISY